jgi:hypothetical protein
MQDDVVLLLLLLLLRLLYWVGCLLDFGPGWSGWI